VVCPLHGHTFDMCTGAAANGTAMSVRSYPVSAVDGTIRITTA
jgi:nitrite reductase (NADH) small subunit